MTMLVLSPEAKAKAHELALYAAQPAHWYRPEVDADPPGDGAAHVVYLDSYRCVFSHTAVAGHLLRHLTLSVAAATEGRLPHPLAAFTLASWFGFTGGVTATVDGAGDEAIIVQPGRDWVFETCRDPYPHVVLQQRICAAPAEPEARCA